MRIGSSRAACGAGTLTAATPAATASPPERSPDRDTGRHWKPALRADGYERGRPGMTLAWMRPLPQQAPAGQAMDAYAGGGWAGSEGGVMSLVIVAEVHS